MFTTGPDPFKYTYKISNYTLRNDNNSDVGRIASLAHFLKGASNTFGITKVFHLAWEIQSTGDDGSLTIEDATRTITKALAETKNAFVVADRTFRAFFKEPEREIDWEQPMKEAMW